jgi:hypothetical protein
VGRDVAPTAWSSDPEPAQVAQFMARDSPAYVRSGLIRKAEVDALPDAAVDVLLSNRGPCREGRPRVAGGDAPAPG